MRAAGGSPQLVQSNWAPSPQQAEEKAKATNLALTGVYLCNVFFAKSKRTLFFFLCLFGLSSRTSKDGMGTRFRGKRAAAAASRGSETTNVGLRFIDAQRQHPARPNTATTAVSCRMAPSFRNPPAKPKVTMAVARKYAGLIDFDDAAPDIYETPELTDDASTVPASSTLRSDSRASSPDGLDGNNAAIDRQQIDPNQARNSFLTNGTQDTASQGWINSKRVAYRSSSKRTLKGSREDEFVDSTDDEDEESLERKLARLRREVAEVKESFQKRRAEAKSKQRVPTIQVESIPVEQKALEPVEALDSLTQILEEIKRPEVVGQDSSSQRLIKTLSGEDKSDELQTTDETTQDVRDYMDNSHGIDPTSSPVQIQTLSKTSDFDKRLRLLETALGMDLIPLPTKDRTASRAVLPVLDGLDRQISSISVSDASLDNISRKIRQMTDDAEKLTETRKAAAAQLTSNQSAMERKRMSTTKSGTPAPEANDDLAQTSKINALYGALPTIESLSPLLPTVLDRLRSLRTIHADAANASESLTKVESRQAAMAEEIKEWREGLEKVEMAVQHGERSMRENMGVVDGWVKELESRIQKTNAFSTV
ncbi:MAG: hypothetical protein Q9221_009170 [Calogaya cf. arnoldii]